ncbi:MAG: hypothetical protein WC501_05435 [Candidatus Micrarchaeia archaeon]|jgi:predicted metal-dependent TIM-barrel fold hydrolase
MSGETVKNKEDLTQIFLKIYTNLPLEERKQVVIFINDEPISWELARNEIIHKTFRSEKILEKLRHLNII